MGRPTSLTFIGRKQLQLKGGSLNKLIDNLPVELHVPSYNYCGPGTNLNKRLLRGDKGKNLLDEACKQHDITYSKYSDIKNRNKADRLLKERALKRFKSEDAKLAERIVALGVAGVMTAKSKLGMGIKKSIGGSIKHRKKNQKPKRVISLQSAILKAKKGIIGKKYNNLKSAARGALGVIKKLNVKISQPNKRIIPIPKMGGLLPLIPLFAGLSALGALSGGAAGIASAVNAAKNARNKLEEQKRHNKVIEQMSIGKGLYLRPYKKGCGLYLKPYSKNC